MSMLIKNDDKSSSDAKGRTLKKISLCVGYLLATALYPWPRSKRLKTGLRLMIDPKRRWIDLNLAFKSKYEEGTLHLIERLLPKSGVFIDVGANIGVMSTYAARLVGSGGVVLAFEPDHVNFGRLIWAREANSLPQLIAFPIALGSEERWMKLQRSPTGDGGLSSLVGAEELKEGCSVLVARLDDLISCVPVSRIDLMKIDVEGFESSVIDGAKNTIEEHKPALIVEMVNDDAVNAGKRLEKFGYVSFIPGEKSRGCNILQRTIPHKLKHNNMLMVHASALGKLSDLGFLIRN